MCAQYLLVAYVICDVKLLKGVKTALSRKQCMQGHDNFDDCSTILPKKCKLFHRNEIFYANIQTISLKTIKNPELE